MDIKAEFSYKISLRNAYYGQFGNLYGIWFNYRGIPSCSIGKQWSFFVFFLVLVSIIGYGITFTIAPYINPSLSISGFCIVTFCLSSFLLTAIVNPGFAYNKQNPMDEYDEDSVAIANYCTHCDIEKE